MSAPKINIEPTAWYRDRSFEFHFSVGAERPPASTSNPDEWKPLYSGDDLVSGLNTVIDAWESLPGGRHYSVTAVQQWLTYDMAKAINFARNLISRSKPS